MQCVRKSMAAACDRPDMTTPSSVSRARRLAPANTSNTPLDRVKEYESNASLNLNLKQGV
jgi:hypothetical protein